MESDGLSDAEINTKIILMVRNDDAKQDE